MWHDPVLREHLSGITHKYAQAMPGSNLQGYNLGHTGF